MRAVLKKAWIAALAPAMMGAVFPAVMRGYPWWGAVMEEGLALVFVAITVAAYTWRARR